MPADSKMHASSQRTRYLSLGAWDNVAWRHSRCTCSPRLTSHGHSLPVRAGADRYGQAMGLAQVLGMRPLVAHCHLGLGKVARHAGEGERARTCVGTAATMYREMGMHFWLKKAEAERSVTPSTNELPAGRAAGRDRLISQSRS